MNILIITAQHFATAPRKTGLHFIADALLEQGHKVDFLSHRVSYLSKLIKDPRWDQAKSGPQNRWVNIKEGFRSYIWLPFVHPISMAMPFLKTLTGWSFLAYEKFLPKAVCAELKKYDVIVIESGISVMLFRVIKAAAPKAKMIYYAADRLNAISTHEIVQRRLDEDAPDYDLIRVVAPSMLDDFPKGSNVRYIPHGVDKDIFDGAFESPYPDTGRKNAVSVGDMLFDAEAVQILAEGNPGIDFHLFGRNAKISKELPNITEHGETPFSTVAKYIKFSDIGLAPYSYSEDADYLGQSSLKLQQYAYCGLPVVAPLFIAGDRLDMFSYENGIRQSILKAFELAKNYDRGAIQSSHVMDWKEVTDEILQAVRHTAVAER